LESDVFFYQLKSRIFTT